MLPSCFKKVTSEGTVYSKHGNPMPNILIQFQFYGSKDLPSSSIEVTTNTSGHFSINTSVRRNDTFGFAINEGDSGYYSSKKLTREKIVHYDITLH